MLVSPDGRISVRYTEMKPSKSLKAFRGFGPLLPLTGVDAPLYRHSEDTLIGFFGGRAFRIEVIDDGGDRDEGLRRAVALGVEIIKANAD